MGKSKLTDQQLVEMYKTMSVTAIAAVNGTSHVTVIRKLHRLKVKMRSKGNNELRVIPIKHGFAKKALELGMEPLRYIRLMAVLKLGGKCRACGTDDLRVLCINHVRGEGKVRRTPTNGSQAVKSRYAESLAVLSEQPTPNLEVLCANCNALHEYERGNIPPIPEGLWRPKCRSASSSPPRRR